MKQLQGEQSDNGAGYVPFSEEWEKEVSKLPKVFLIEMLKKANLERIEYRDKLAASHPVQSVKQGQEEERFMPPDSDDICWHIGSKTFTRKEVSHLLWTQRAMIGNDLKTLCGNEMTKEMFEILDNPRKPVY